MSVTEKHTGWQPLAKGVTLLTALIAAGCTPATRRALTGPAPIPTSPSRSVTTPAVPARPPAAPAIPADLPKPDTVVTLSQVIDVALAHNPLTRASYRQARSAHFALREAKGPFLPTVDLSGTASRGALSADGSEPPTVTDYGPGLTLNYLLLDFGGRGGYAEEARQALLAADWNHNAQVQNVVFTVQAAYFQYLGSRALAEAAATSLKQAQAALEAANIRHDAGIATIADVLLAKTVVSQAELQLQTYEGLVMTTRGNLATAMGLPTTLWFEVGTLPESLPVDALTDKIETLLANASANRPDLQATRALAEKASVHISTVRSDLLPTLSLQATASQLWYEPYQGSTNQTNWSGRLLFNVPLFSGFAKQANLSRAKEDAAAARAQLDLTEQQVMQQVWTSYYTAATANRQVTTSRDLLASADMAEKVALGRYREGVGTILDLLVAQSALANARAQDVEARAGWLIALAKLAHDVGVTPRLDQANFKVEVSQEKK